MAMHKGCWLALIACGITIQSSLSWAFLDREKETQHLAARTLDIESLRSARVISIVQQESVKSQFVTSHYGADTGSLLAILINPGVSHSPDESGLALIGSGLLISAIDSYLDKRGQIAIEKELAPLHVQAGNLDFHKEFIQILQRSDIANDLPKIREAILFDKSELNKQKAEAAFRASTEDYILFLVSQYYFTDSYVNLNVNTKAVLWRKGKIEPLEVIDFTAQSAAITPDRSRDKRKIALSLWMENGADIYRKTLQQGINEVSKLLRIGLFENSTAPGREIEKNDKGRIFTDSDGHYYSLAYGARYSNTWASLPPLNSEMGRIYFYRPAAQIEPFQPSVMLNNESVGVAFSNSFFYVDRSPGDYQISLASSGEWKVLAPQFKPLKLSLARGESKYVRMTEFDPEREVAPRQIDIMGQAQATSEMMELVYVGTPLDK